MAAQIAEGTGEIYGRERERDGANENDRKTVTDR